MRTFSPIFAFVAFVSSAVPALARAEGPPERVPEFGRRGRFVLDELIGFTTGTPVIGGAASGIGSTGLLSFGTVTSTMGDVDVKGTFVAARPSFDVFVADRISIGGAVRASYMWTNSAGGNGQGGAAVELRSYGLGIEPRIGYALPIADSLYLWPRAGVGYRHDWIEQGGALTAATGTWSAFTRVGLVATLGRVAFLDLAPELRISRTVGDSNVSSGTSGTAVSLGVTASLGLAF